MWFIHTSRSRRKHFRTQGNSIRNIQQKQHHVHEISHFSKDCLFFWLAWKFHLLTSQTYGLISSFFFSCFFDKLSVSFQTVDFKDKSVCLLSTGYNVFMLLNTYGKERVIEFPRLCVQLRPREILDVSISYHASYFRYTP